MKKVLSLMILLFVFAGCGGGGGTKPTIMRGSLNFHSDSKEAKVALLTLDTNNNLITVSCSKKITHSETGWGWGDFSTDLPIVTRDSVLGIMPFDDTNKNNKFDEIDDENLIDSVWLWAVHDASSKRWDIENDQGYIYGYLPGYEVELEADYTKSGSRAAVLTETVNHKDIKAYKAALRAAMQKHNAL
ncbi:MAG: hypothetical protein WCV58_04475 [Patescibacteria group bacterium]